MADWLRWYGPSESSYRQEAVKLVRHRAKRLVPLLTPLAQPVPVSRIEAQKTVKLIKAEITNAMARDVIAHELSGLTGRKFTRAEAVSLACRIAGSAFVASQGVSPGLLSNEGGAYECLGVVHAVNLGEQFGEDQLIVLRLIVSNGPYTSERIELQFGFPQMSRWAQLFGLSDRRAHMKMKTPRQYLDANVVMRLERDNGRVNCLGVTVTDSMRCYNRKLSKRRLRLYTPCPFGANFDCIQCGVGRNQCSISINTEKTSVPLEVANDQATG